MEAASEATWMLTDPVGTRLEAAPRATWMLVDTVATRMLADQEEVRLEAAPLSFLPLSSLRSDQNLNRQLLNIDIVIEYLHLK